MPKLIYAEPDDEITSLVDRLRSEKSEKELVFVLPAASRVMHSSLNARLLMQYSNSLGKKTSIVSPDPRTQAVAIEIGFDTFPTMAAFEAGKVAQRPVEGRGPAAPAPLVPAVDDVPPVAAPRRPITPGPGPRPPQARPLAGRPVTSGAVTEERRSTLPWVLGGIGVLAVILILVLAILPQATVTIVTRATAVSAAPTVTGAPVPPDPKAELTVQTNVLTTQQQQQQGNVPSTGQKTIPGNKATGAVVLRNHLIFTNLDFPAGTEVYTDSNVKFVTTQAATANPGSSTGLVPIAAEQPGPGSNVGAHTIVHISGADSNTATADNPDATSGGTDPTTKTVVAQLDIDNLKKSLGDQLTQKAKDDLKKQAGANKLLDETMVVSVDIQPDHKAGDEVGNFNATVTVKAQVTTVSDDAVKKAIKHALEKQLPNGYELLTDGNSAPKIDYRLVQHDDKGNVIFDGVASGFEAVKVDTEDVRKHVAGKSPHDAQTYIRQNAHADDVIIRESPDFVPWLPFLASQIHLNETVDNPQPG